MRQKGETEEGIDAQRVAYPCGLRASAKVVSFSGSPPIDSPVNTKFLPCEGPGACGAYTLFGEPIPLRTGNRPVIIAAREGVHTWNPEYQVWKTIPSAASW
jgi:hypothetical protein